MHDISVAKVTLPSYFFTLYSYAKDDKETILSCIERSLKNYAYLLYISNKTNRLNIINRNNRIEKLSLQIDYRLYKNIEGDCIILTPNIVSTYVDLGFNLDKLAVTIVYAMSIQNKLNLYVKNNKVLNIKDTNNEKQKIYLL